MDNMNFSGVTRKQMEKFCEGRSPVILLPDPGRYTLSVADFHAAKRSLLEVYDVWTVTILYILHQFSPDFVIERRNTPSFFLLFFLLCFGGFRRNPS